MNNMEAWFQERDKWLQTAVTLRLSKGTLTKTDYQLLAKLCLKEAGDVSITDSFLGIPKGAISHTVVAEPLRIKEIRGIKGINALKPDKPLTFGQAPIVIVYGDTGAGKSGYSRLIRHACGSRFAGELHGDAFDPTTVDQEAIFEVEVSGKTLSLEWKRKSGPVGLLTQVNVFDTECATTYLAKQNEPAFEPFIIRLLAATIADCDAVKAHLDSEKKLLPTALPLIPETIKDGTRSKWYESLNAESTDVDVESNCSFTQADLSEMTNLEIELNKVNPKEAIAKLQKTLLGIEGLAQDLSKLKTGLDVEVGSQIRQLRATAKTRRTDALTVADKLFNGKPLDGIGSEQWRRMWETARAYSEEVAYKGKPFPLTSDDAVCVLCQQPLVEGRKHLNEFDAFVKDAIEASANTAEAALAAAVQAVKTVPDLAGLEGRFEAAGSIVTDVATLHDSLTSRRQWIVADSTEVAPPCAFDAAIAEMDALKTDCTNQITNLKALEIDAERATKVARLRDLKVRQWLLPQKPAIRDEINRKIRIALIDKAIDHTGTAALTVKKNKLSEELLAAGHTARFESELIALNGGHLPVKISHIKANKSGKPGFAVGLNNPKKPIPLPAVLSEGQNRVVALASFFADVTAGAKGIPFIFDDPISSLDQDFEEATARRLVEESNNRQVIVFTHRLSLLASVSDAAKKAGIDCEITSIRGHPFGQGTPHQTFLNHAEPDKALNILLKQQIPAAEKELAASNPTGYDMAVKAICSDFRIIQERTIEKVLLNDVVERFRRPLHTKNKLEKLSKIEGKDCSLLDSLMTKYSFAEHSQPLQSPAPPLKLPEIRKDVEDLLAWIKEFKIRP